MLKLHSLEWDVGRRGDKLMSDRAQWPEDLREMTSQSGGIAGMDHPRALLPPLGPRNDQHQYVLWRANTTLFKRHVVLVGG